MFRALKRTFRLLVLIVVLAIVALVGIQLYVVNVAKPYLLPNAQSAPQCDAIMVLGAKVYNNGNPSSVLADRLNLACELYAQGKAPKILVSGDHGHIDYDEVNTMRDYLVEKGIPIEDIFMDHAGFNTYDSMYRAKAIFGIKRLLVCTQDFHISRSIYLAHELGIEAYGYPCQDKTVYKRTLLYLREYLARTKAVYDVVISRGPKYLGDPIPISGSGLATE